MVIRVENHNDFCQYYVVAVIKISGFTVFMWGRVWGQLNIYTGIHQTEQKRSEDSTKTQKTRKSVRSTTLSWNSC